MKAAFKILAALAASSTMLTGCAVYGPPPVAYGPTQYYPSAPVYVQSGDGYYYAPSGPVYVQPAPVYYGPPVTFSFDLGYWWGGGRRWGGHRR